MEGVLVADPTGEIVLASTGASRILGIDKEALCMPTKLLERRFHLGISDGAANLGALSYALTGRRFEPHEQLAVDASGRERTLVMSANPLSEYDLAGAVLVFADVTEHRRLEAELRRSIAFRERLMGIVSHDLRQPLSAIALAMHLLLSHRDAPAWIIKPARRSQKSVERMSRMVSDLLDFARIQAHLGLPIAPEEMDARETIRETIDEFDVSHADRIELHTHGGPAVGMWDSDRLAQAVANLLKNAVEHGTADTPIVVGLWDEPTQIRITVENQGETIPTESQNSIFDPFRHSGSERRGGGLGLGLHIVYEVAKAHHGNVTVNSEAGRTTFTLTLPK
ncbi:MAG: HAMP domain-containing sensor histidine kinase [Myxococcaceae bacterium]